jgi:acetyl esterase/lipase
MKNGLFLFLNFISGIAIGQPPSDKDISYLPASHPEYDKERHILDVYMPDNITKKTEVVVFIHGGKWKVGNKNTYRFLGKKLAKHNVVTVVINYRLSPVAKSYASMAMDCANAVKWVYEHIEEYGGDKNRIYLYGHSSGGHLSALIAANDRFFDSVGIANPVKGCVLLDPFGLNIDRYLQTAPAKDKWMYEIFTKDPEIWKDASPVNFIKEDTLRYLMYTGGSSPVRIQHDSELFYEATAQKGKDIQLTTLYNASHLTILFQLYYTKHRLYKEFIKFMNP